MLNVPAPTALNGETLTAELEAAGVPVDDLAMVGDTLRVGADDEHRATVERVVSEHIPPPPADPEPSLAERLAAVEARLDKAANATVTGDAAKLRDNLR